MHNKYHVGRDLSQERIKTIFGEIDMNEDGKITFEEFNRMMQDDESSPISKEKRMSESQVMVQLTRPKSKLHSMR
jgi:hypothetical protein